MKGEKYKAVMTKMFTIVCGLLILFSSGCGDGNKDVKSHLNEQDFAQNPSLVATPDDVVIINLEPETAGVDANDTHLPGLDRIPIRFPKDVSHKFVLEFKGDSDAYFALLLDNNGNEVLRVDRGITEVTQNIAAGEYTFEIHHGGGIDSAYTLFVRPGSTYTGGDCPGCDLTGANLTGANLKYATLPFANLTDTNLADTNLYDAILTDANLTDANLTDADLTYANLTRANLTRANLTGAFLYNANLTRANLTGAKLSDELPTEEYMAGANLSGATWTDGITICSDSSFGTCN